MPKFYPYLFDYANRREVYMGSAGSAKSFFITQKLILKGLKSRRKILVCRRFGTTLRNSVFALFIDVLAKWQLLPLCKVRQTDMYIKLPNDTEIIFIGLDSEEKLLSISGITDIFIEEAFEISREIYEQLELRLRAPQSNLQIFMAFNPISQKSWLYEFCTNLPPNSLYLHSTYLDNPFLPADYVQTIEDMKSRNPAKFRIFGLGEWGIDPAGQVYTNWRKLEFDPQQLAHLEHRVGMDLGYIDPTTIVLTLYDKPNQRIYIYKEYYKAGASLDEVAEGMDKLNLGRTKVHCDSAEPRTIKFFQTKGYTVVAAKKGKGSVEGGIAFLQNHEIIVHNSCTNTIADLENYCYLKDKKTGEYTNATDHSFSHTLDGLRYAYSDIYNKTTLSIGSKSALGL